MGQVAVTIHGHDYKISCADGEEERITRLAAYVDERLGELIGSVGDLGDLRLLVMTNLVVADKLFVADQEIERLRAKAELGVAPRRADGGLAPLVDAVAQRIEDLAARLESA